MALFVLLIVVLYLAQADAFIAGRWQVAASGLSTSVQPAAGLRRYMGEVYHDGTDCEQRLKDHNGRCPGHSGYVPQVVQNNTPSNFADFQKAMAEKKRKASDAKGLKK